MTIDGNDCSNSGDEAEFIKPGHKKYPHDITIQHWQLRDLLTCPNNKREYIYASENSVNLYNTQTRQITPMLKNLLFSPASITTGCDYLAAGGQRSQLMVRHLQNNWITETAVGGTINNALCISQHFDGTRLLICNNDETIKVYTLPLMQRIAVLSLPTAVNHASVSPDGKKMVAVGDSNQVFLFDISANGTYKKTATYTALNESSFSCSWNQTSEKFAVASQDGIVSVWDVRSSNKLCELGSRQPGHRKCAARCVKFSPSGLMDLLIYTEHVSYVNVVDARTFNSTQSIRVAPPNGDVNISGCAWTPDGRGVFVGTDRFVLEYEVNTTLRRSFPHGALL